MRGFLFLFKEYKLSNQANSSSSSLVLWFKSRGKLVSSDLFDDVSTFCQVFETPGGELHLHFATDCAAKARKWRCWSYEFVPPEECDGYHVILRPSYDRWTHNFIALSEEGELEFGRRAIRRKIKKKKRYTRGRMTSQHRYRGARAA